MSLAGAPPVFRSRSSRRRNRPRFSYTNHWSRSGLLGEVMIHPQLVVRGEQIAKLAGQRLRVRDGCSR